MDMTTGDRIMKVPPREPKPSAAALLRFSREEFLRAYIVDREMTMIPWNELWGLLRDAKARGHTPMIDSFYDQLFREARFDDKGAWTPAKRTL